MSYIVGIDIGATNIRHVLCLREEDEYLDHSIQPFIEYEETEKEVYGNLVHPVFTLCEKNGIGIKELTGIGIALAAVCDKKSGIIMQWGHHKKWEGFSLLSFLKQYFVVNAVLEDDANCAAAYEYSMIGDDYDSMLYITVSTGIGCGIIIKGEIYQGPDYPAGELGHIKISDGRTRCSCGEYGCLQSVLSGNGIKEAIISKHSERGFHIANTGKLEDVIESAAFNRELIWEVLSEKAETMRDVLITLKRLFGLNHFVLGGGVISGLPDFYRLIEEKVKNYDPAIHIISAGNNKYNGALGAIQILKNAGGLQNE